MEKSVQRYKNLQENFSKWSIERICAVKADPGFVGCALSHLKCIEIAKQRNLEWVLVLEDDCLPYDSENLLSYFTSLLPVLYTHRDKWDIFSGGCTQVAKIDSFYSYGDIEFAQVQGLTTHFVLYNRLCYERILNTYPTENPIPIDNFYRDFFRSWLVVPFLAKQTPGFSVIENAQANYDKLFLDAMDKIKSFRFLKPRFNLLSLPDIRRHEFKLVAFVINLPERYERWKTVKKNWSHIFDIIVRVNGIRSPVPHSGCGLAHISAIKLAFLSYPGKPAIILEDDVVPEPSLTKETFLDVYMEASRLTQQYDAIYLKPMCQEVVMFRKTKSLFFHDFEPTQNIFCNAFMIYSPRIGFLEEYENHLLTEKTVVPIDRLLTSDSFAGYFYEKPVSWLCTKLKTNLKDLGSDNNGDPKFSTNLIYINTPRYLQACLRNINPERQTQFRQELNLQKQKSQKATNYWLEEEEGDTLVKSEPVWVRVGNENDEVKIHNKCTLRYGVDGMWIEKVFTPGYYKLDNMQFKADPAKGKKKYIEKLII